MIGIEEHIGPCHSEHSPEACVCGRPSRAVQVTKFATIFSFSLFITERKLVYRCFSCNRLKQTDMSISGINDGLGKLVFGWGQLLLLIGMLTLGYNFAYPNDQRLREAPRVGDILVVNLFEITREPKDQPHPYTLAKITQVEDDEVQLQVGRWQYLREFATFRDMLSRQDLMSSYFSNRNIKVSQLLLDETQAVRSIRRRHSFFDLDEIHESLFFQTKVQQAPSIN